MSRVGKAPVPIPDKTKVEINGSYVKVTGPKGELSRTIHEDITAALEDNQVIVTRSSDLKKHRSLHGLTRSLLNNMVIGVSDGYKKVLKIIGVGYKAEVKGARLVLNLGFSHPIIFQIPEGINITVEPKVNLVTVEGIDKELVGACAAKIRSFRKPEPFKGKGVRYIDEYVRSKAGKSAVGSGA
ncbi:MAG: 50S ribosomal protein L6 [candidate division Zixibacteria bacterium]|nr:50S ribosomal protein L6 [candidate division Zixibacteria bacterium]